jgi:hypothetical protein
VIDPEHHGRKSQAQRFDGFKAAVTVDAESKLIPDVADMSASDGDGQHLPPVIQRVAEHVSAMVERVIGTGIGALARRAPTAGEFAGGDRGYPHPLSRSACVRCRPPRMLLWLRGSHRTS